MTAFQSILTTAALLTHSVLGCCWHHSHQCKPKRMHVVSYRVAAPALPVQYHSCRHHQPNSTACDTATDNGRHGTDGDQPCDRQRCNEGDCSFLTVVRVDTERRMASTRSATFIDVECAGASTQTHLESVVRSRSRGWQCPVPLRALTQVWRV